MGLFWLRWRYFLGFYRFWRRRRCTGLPVSSVYILVFIVGLLGFWIDSKPGGTLGGTLRTGVGSGNTLWTASKMLLVEGAVALGSFGGIFPAS